LTIHSSLCHLLTSLFKADKPIYPQGKF
jgi:hypothetical protein